MDRALLAQLISKQYGERESADSEAGSFAAVLAGQVSDPLLAALITNMIKGQPIPRSIKEKELEIDRALARSKRLIERQQAELASAQRMANYFAEVFGACPRCWGLSVHCPDCRGTGGPGSRTPIESEVRRWMVPALTALGLNITGIGQTVRWHEEQNAREHLRVNFALGGAQPASPEPERESDVGR